ncbi:Alpha/Beta hydrolase protein [Aspergillus pseudoustus]|uniref:Alpha/Beta hydrolase protein n=1 Tax=Aspergillus pseudoustus TaxID=1810923 RepID=A0ABR4KM97_9EURO
MTKNQTLTRLRFLLTFLFSTVPTSLVRIPSAIIRAWLKNLPLGPSIWNGFAGALMATAPPRQLQAILPSTIETYKAWAASQRDCAGVEEIVVEAAGGDDDGDDLIRLLWIGPRRRGGKVLLFFHGGGYVMPLSRGHLDWMDYVRKEAVAAGVELSVCVLEYDLIPENPYPRQVNQAILGFEHLLASGYAPSEIVIGGDSAGGHLSLSLLAHLHRPRPSSPSRGRSESIRPSDRIRGCFLVSPLSSLNCSTPSYNNWFSADVLGKKVVSTWGAHLVDNSPWHAEISAGKGWGMALDVPESWWDGVDVVDRILVTGGDEEVFSDHVQELGAMLKRRSKGEVALYMARREAHDGPLMDFAAGREASETTRVVTGFVVSCLKS